MGEDSLPDREQPSVNRRWLWALRIASMLFLFLSLALTVLFVLEPRLPLPYRTSVISLFLYAVVLWGLRTTPPRKPALGLAVVLGSFWFALSASYALLSTARLFPSAAAQRPSLDILLLLAGSMWLLTLLEGVCVGVALKIYRPLVRARGDVPIMVGAVVGGLVFGVLVLFAIGFLYAEMQPGQSPAVGSLRTINTAEITYAYTYERGYSPSLAELGLPPRGMQPSASAAGLIDSVLASGTKRYQTYRVAEDIVDDVEAALGREPRHAYRYEYKPGPRDEHGRINSYTICARPIGERRASYFTDESGVIRETYEDRCPNEKDYPVAG